MFIFWKLRNLKSTKKLEPEADIIGTEIKAMK